MDLVTSIRTCFSKSNDFTGRASRSEFQNWMLFLFAGFALVMLLTQVTVYASTLGAIFVGMTFLPTVAVAERRRMDMRQSAYWRARLAIHIPAKL